MTNQKHIKQSFASDFSRDAREGHLIKRGLESKMGCPYLPFCNVSKISNQNCSFPDYENCQTYKFYKKYKY